MPLLTILEEKSRVPNFALPKEGICMNCGKLLGFGTNGLYERRFCSIDCKEEYCSHL